MRGWCGAAWQTPRLGLRLGGGCRSLGAEMFLEKCEDLAPAARRLLRPMRRARGVEEGVAGAVVAIELVALAEPLEHLFGAVEVLAIGILVVVAEQPEQRTLHLLGQV